MTGLPRRKFTAEFRAQALRLVKDGGAPQAEVARQLGISDQTLATWVKQARKGNKGYGMQASMSRKGNCYDNAAAESFFATLKKELVHRCRFATRAQAKEAVFEYIEVFYNRLRRHSKLGNLAPVEFERRYYAAMETA